MAFLQTSPVRLYHKAKPKQVRSLDTRPQLGAMMTSSSSINMTNNGNPINDNENSSSIDRTQTQDFAQTSSTDDATIKTQPGTPKQMTGRLARFSQIVGHAKTRDSIMTTNSSPTDPAYVPYIGKAEDDNTTPMLGQPSPSSTNPDRTSFFDLSSKSDTSIEDLPSVFHRASSVRMTKPSITQRNPYSPGLSTALVDEVPKEKDVSDVVQVLPSKAEDQTYTMDSGNVSEDNPLQARKTIGYTFTDGTSVETIKKCGFSPGTTAPEDIQAVSSVPQKKSQKHVMISPLDTATSSHPSTFRELIVSTPYPNKSSASERLFNFRRSTDTEKSSIRAQLCRSKNITSDRPEVLVLEFGLAKHPCTRITMEIDVLNPDTFDDELLFHQIRIAYFRHLLGLSKISFALVRIVINATAIFPFNIDNDGFNTTHFLQHFKNPRSGRGCKVWIAWLRSHNPSKTTRSMEPLTDRTSAASRNEGINAALKEEVLSVDSTTQERSQLTKKEDMITSSGRWTSWPSPKSLALKLSSPMPIEQACQSFFHKKSSSIEDPQGVTILLHHAFSFPMIAFLTFCTLLWSVSAIILWIVFGVPGLHAGQVEKVESTTGLPRKNDTKVSTVRHGRHLKHWGSDAHLRILTGLVLGLTTLLLGVVFDLCIIFGGWLLL